MDGFFKKVNQKVNLGQCWRPPAHPPGYHYFKGQGFEKRIQKHFLCML